MSELNKSPEFDQEIKGLRRQIDLERKQGIRPVFQKGRMYEGGVNVLAVAVRAHDNTTNCVMRVTQRDIDEGKADQEDLGKFWFVPGYSIVGGGDIIKP